MVRPLQEYFAEVKASDVHDYGAGFPVLDFLFPQPGTPRVDWVITNPPFRLAEDFIHRGLEVANEGVAVLVRTNFLESVGRYQRLFKRMPPTLVCQFAERVVIHKGRLSPDGSTATAYCWLVWHLGVDHSQFRFIPPCRTTLERESDYPPEPVEVEAGDLL